jgi:tetratricopeptide (TPR) repeat protein
MGALSGLKKWLVRALLLSALAVAAHPVSAAESVKDLLAAGRVDDAIHQLQSQLAHSPSDAESQNLLCRAYLMIEDWNRAVSTCERARNLNPSNSQYELWLGRAYGEKADHSPFFVAWGLAGKVRDSFERAVQLDPKNWQARADLSEYYVEAPPILGGGKEKALRQADAIMPINPPIAHWVLARVAEKVKDPVQAEREYRAEIAASHSAARGWVDLANFLRHANRFDEMEKALQNLESCPLDHPESLMDGANLLVHTNRNAALAIRLLRRYLTSPVEEGPAFRAHEQLGQLLEKQGDRRTAAEEYHAALALFHDDARAQEGLNRVAH